MPVAFTLVRSSMVCGAASLLLACGTAQAQLTTTTWPTGTGFANVPRTEGQLVTAPFATNDGRMAILAWHNGILFSIPESPSSQPGSNLQTRMWSLMDPSTPRAIANAPGDASGSLGTTAMPINAHGYFHVGQNMATRAPGPFLVIGPDWPPTAPWSFRAQSGVPGVTRQSSNAFGAGVRGVLSQPWFVDQTWWSYNAVGGNASLYTNGPPGSPGSQLQSTWDHLGMTGVIGHPFLIGNLLIFASDQSRTGVATYDISNPQQPVLLDVLTAGGPGGYWPEVWGNDGELYIVFPYNDNGNGMRVVDATDPSALRFVADVPLARPNGSSGAMYAQFQDEFAFIGDHKIDMRTRQSVRQFATISNGIDISQFALPLGNLLVTGGVGEDQGIAIFAHQAAPDTRPPSVGFHIPRAGQTSYPRSAAISLLIHETLDTLSIVNGSSFRVRRVLGASFGPPLAGRWTFSFDDVFTFQPDALLDADATYEVRLDGIRDAAGNAMPAYAYTFSTGGSVSGNMPPVVNQLTSATHPAAPGANVAFTAAASDPNSDALQYRFDFGDGSPKTAWAAAAAASHAYAQRGHYRAVVQARDPSGTIASRVTTVTVVEPLGASRPTASSPLVCDSPRRRIWSVNPDTDSISALHADTLTKIAEYPVCADPRSLARAPGGQLWVTCFDDDQIRIVNETNGTLVATLDTGYGSGPTAVAVSPDGTRAFVSLSNRGELRRYDSASRALTGSLPLGRDPRALAVSADGARVLVTRFLSPLHHAEVWDVNAATMQLTRTIRIPKIGGDANPDNTAAGRGVANQLAAIVLSPRGAGAFVAASKPNSERGRLIHPGHDLDEDNTVRNLLVQIDPDGASASARFRRALDLDNSDSSSAVGFSPLGDYLFVTLQGMNEVLVLDALALEGNTGLGTLVNRVATGAAPQGVCSDADSGRTFVHNFLDRNVSVLETEAFFENGTLQIPRSNVSMVASETLPADVLQGKRIFYHAGDTRMSAEGYISCATCHLDGSHDGRVWDFSGRSEGLRNTTTLSGRGGMTHGKVHWSANFDEIQDFENDIRTFFGGSGFMQDADFIATMNPLGAPKAGRSPELDRLSAYVSSLNAGDIRRSPFRSADGTMSMPARAGQEIFSREGCAACHTPPRYTDSTVAATTLHNVGTLRASSGSRIGQPLVGIDTPTLLGVWADPPYFHDGSADTLADVFRVTGGLTYTAESAQRSGGAALVDTFVEINNDDTVRGRAYVSLESAAQLLTFNGVNGGPGGQGAIEVRFSNSRAGVQTQALTVRVNGASLPIVALPASENDPNWRSTQWNRYRIEGVALNAGTTNTVELSTDAWYVNIDEILVAHAGYLAQAQPHRRVLTLPQTERNDLLAFLQQLDGSDAGVSGDLIFYNGFQAPE